MVTNIAFLYVLARFPAFLRHVKAGGAEADVVVRLSTFYELNVRHFPFLDIFDAYLDAALRRASCRQLFRVILRFGTALPLLVLASDGIRGTHPVNTSL